MSVPVRFKGGDEGWHRPGGGRPDLRQRVGGRPPYKFVGVFEGVDEGWQRLCGSRPDLRQRVGGPPPDRYVGVFKGVDAGRTR
jgi:hypothetical protein